MQHKPKEKEKRHESMPRKMSPMRRGACVQEEDRYMSAVQCVQAKSSSRTALYIREYEECSMKEKERREKRREERARKKEESERGKAKNQKERQVRVEK